MDITIILTDEEVACLENDLLDVEAWVNEAVQGKINNCKKRLQRDWIPKLIADQNVISIPADETELLSMIFAHEDYKNRSDIEQQA